VRRGADYGGRAGGKDDVKHEHYSVEVKLLGRPSYADLLNAAKQAEKNAEPHKEPIAVVKRKNALDDDALVVMRFSVFREWRVEQRGSDT
jgi:hypothetical protein